MAAQILRINHLYPKFDQPQIAPRPAVRKADQAICPVCGGHRGPSVMKTLKRGAVVLCLVMTHLAALALLAGIFIAVLKYAANEANGTFYEMNYNHIPSTER